MADLSSRPMYRSSSILSKKLSGVSHTSFRGGKSVYDDVFGSSSSSSPSSKKLKATFSARMEDYCEMFNCSSSSSIPFLDLPDVDAVVSVPTSGSDYAAIFGNSLEEAWIESGTTSPSDEDEHASGLERNGLPSEDNEMYETVDGKKQFKMSYHQTSIGRSDGMSGTTHIAQLHAVSGFTCVIDEVPPLRKSNSTKPKPVPLIDDLSSDRDIQEGVKEEKYREKVPSNLPKIGFTDGVQSNSFSNGVQSIAHKEAILEHKIHKRDVSSSRPNIHVGLNEEIYRENVSLNLPESGFKDVVQSESLLNDVQFNTHKEAILEHEDSSSLPDIHEGLKEEKYLEKVSSDLPNCGFKEDGRSRSESFSNVLQFNAHDEPISKHETHERDGLSFRPDIQEGSMEDNFLKTFSSNLSNGVSKESGSSSSFPTGMQFNAFSFGSNTHHATESSSNYGEHETDEFLNAMDDTPTFSDEEVDMNSSAAASATAVRKAIELAQESIKLAKEVMDKHKGNWNSATYSSRSDVKVKEWREIKIAGEVKKLKEDKSQRLQEPKDDTIGIFSGMNRESARNSTYFPIQGVIKETDGKHYKFEPFLSEYERGGDRTEEAADLPSGTGKSETKSKTSLIIEGDIMKDTLQTDDESDEIWQSAMDSFESSDSDSESLKVEEEDFVPTQFGLNVNAVNVGEQELENSANKIESGEKIPDTEGTENKLEQIESAVDTFESSDSDSVSLKEEDEAFARTQFGLNVNAVNVDEQELENSANKIELDEYIPDIEGTENKLEDIENHVESEELNETKEQEGCVEASGLQEPVEHTNEYTTKPWEDYEYKEEAKESQKQLESDIHLNEAQNGEIEVLADSGFHNEEIEVFEDSDSEVHEIKLEGVTVIVEKMHASRLEEGHGCSGDVEKAFHELEVQEMCVGVRTEKNEAEDQELEFDDYDNGEAIENRLDGEDESEGYVILNEAWKPEELDNILQEVGWGRDRSYEHRHNYQMEEEEEADEVEDCGLKHRRPYQKQEQESNVNTTRESLTRPEKVHYVIQGEVVNLRGAGESRIEEDRIANMEGVQTVFTQEKIPRMDKDIKSDSELEESEEETDAVELEHEDKETYIDCVDGDVVGHDDHQIENNSQDVSTSSSTEVEEITKSEVNEEELKTAGLAKEIEPKEMFTSTSSYEEEYEFEVEDLVIELEEKVKLETASLSEEEVMHEPASLSEEEEVAHETASLSEEEVTHETASLSEEEVLVETASSSEEEQEHNDAENSLKDEGAAFFIEESVLNLGVANIKSGHEHIDQNTEEGLACGAGMPVEESIDKFEESKKKEETEVPALDQVKELNEIKAANADENKVENENKMDADGLNSLPKGKENTAEAAQDTRTDRYTEAVEKLNRTSIAEEKEPNTNRDEAKEKDRERVAVERAIREARERAFADVRERAEKAAMEKSIEEARQRIKMSVRERLDKDAEANSSKASKVSMEAKRKSERAAVKRATEEARKRALEKAMSEKATTGAKGNHQGVGSSSGVSERFDDGTKPEPAERYKAKLEKNQRIVERAAKALEEKNRRDLLAQREQAERNRYAETLDADVKRWSNGKTGNLRALLSTLQYILGPDGGWQPVHLNDIVSNSDVKKAYRRATLLVHPDKLQQRGASIHQKYICEKVFDLLKEAWNRFSSEDR